MSLRSARKLWATLPKQENIFDVSVPCRLTQWVSKSVAKPAENTIFILFKGVLRGPTISASLERFGGLFLMNIVNNPVELEKML